MESTHGRRGGVVLAMILVAPLAMADVPPTVSVTQTTTDACEPGVSCTNAWMATKSGAVNGKLAVPAAASDAYSSVRTIIRFSNTFAVPAGTREITYHAFWRFRATAATTGVDARAGCLVYYSAHRHLIYSVVVGARSESWVAIGSLPADATLGARSVTTTFPVAGNEYRKEITLWTELDCSARARHQSTAEVELFLDSALVHLHATDQDGNPLPPAKTREK